MDGVVSTPRDLAALEMGDLGFQGNGVEKRTAKSMCAFKFEFGIRIRIIDKWNGCL